MGTDPETQAAWEAARYIIENCSVEWGVRAGHVPALVEAANAPEYTGIVEMQGFRDSVPNIVYVPRVPQHEAIAEALIGNLSAAMQGQTGIEEALSAAESKVNELLATA
jgi:maltose-binding protein MalE